MDNNFIRKVIHERLDHYGISLLTLARKTGVNYNGIYASLGNGKRNNRSLKPTELIAICKFLEIDLSAFEKGE